MRSARRPATPMRSRPAASVARRRRAAQSLRGLLPSKRRASRSRFARRRAERLPSAVFDVLAERQQRFRRALDDHLPFAAARGQNRDAAALEVERQIVDRVASSVASGAAARKASSRLLRIPLAKWLLRRPARARERYRRRRCRAADKRDFASVSVPVLSVHRTSIAPRSWMADKPLDDHLALGHAHGAARQGDGHHHRQQLGREADGQRHREQEDLEEGR